MYKDAEYDQRICYGALALCFSRHIFWGELIGDLSLTGDFKIFSLFLATKPAKNYRVIEGGQFFWAEVLF